MEGCRPGERARDAGSFSADTRRMTHDWAGPPRRTEPELRLTPQLIFGLVVIAAGVLFTLDNLGLVRAEQYTRFWPVALILFGALRLAQAHGGSGAVTGFIFLAAGIWLLLEELTSFRVHLEDIWPLLLVVLGGYLVWQGLSTRAPSPPVKEGSATTLSGIAILGAFTRGSNSKAFRGGDLTAIMGACEIDLRNAAINGEATIDVFTMWGGIEIRVPESWTIESRVLPLLGGFEDKTRAPQGASAHRLIVRGFAIMGGVEVKN